MRYYSNTLIIGTGVAGLMAALKSSTQGSVILLTKDKALEANTYLAQGGVAACLDAEDSLEQHVKDTCKAGVGACDPKAVEVLVGEGSKVVRDLIEQGMNFDKDNKGNIHLTREGAHSHCRVLHAGGDATGKELMSFLLNAVQESENIKIFEYNFAKDLIIDESGYCCGATSIDLQTAQENYFFSQFTVLATGGAGQVYSPTTNSAVATGDGVAMAYRAGAKVTGMEFYQFHPTVFSPSTNKTFLISEAVRGEGGRLVTAKGETFMEKYHPLKELGPRDVVARAICTESQSSGGRIYLDISHESHSFLSRRFPTIYKTCLDNGIDIANDPIPISPAAHYMMGGIMTDLHGQSSIPGLYACGETAYTGVHGANRLASNSLLEGLVFGARVAEDGVKSCGKVKFNVKKYNRLEQQRQKEQKSFILTETKADKDNKELFQERMFNNAGIVRHKKKLLTMLEYIKEMQKDLSKKKYNSKCTFELENMLTTGSLIVTSALVRKESRGAHFRSDYPDSEKIFVLNSRDGCKLDLVQES